jgi:bacterioferritin-associated ferredoxin
MYICICKAISDSDIQQMVHSGAQSADDIEQRCGAGSDCGSCRDEIGDLVRAHLRNAAPSRPQRVSVQNLSLAA